MDAGPGSGLVSAMSTDTENADFKHCVLYFLTCCMLKGLSAASRGQ